MRDFDVSKSLRTDLAQETLEQLHEQNGRKIPGLISQNSRQNGFNIHTLRVSDQTGEAASGKKIGTYLTLDVGKIWLSEKERFRAAAETLAACLRSLFPKNLSADAPCMLAALGNRAIIADAVGPMTADHFIVTRHIKAADKAMFDSLGLRETLCVVPGVSGNTGMEAAEIAAGVSSLAKPGFIVAVDALASRRLSRLATTVQICDTGISPGSGICNTRKAFDKETFGVPVIAIGVPTVVEVTTLAIDVIQTAFQSMDQAKKPDEQTVGGIIDKIAAHHGESFFVTPKETDHILKDTAKLIGYGLNLALHDALSFDDIDEFLS